MLPLGGTYICNPRPLWKADKIDKVADKLPGWKAALLNRAGRAAMVRFVLSAVPIYQLIAINVPKWFIRAIDKIRRDFFGQGRRKLMVAAVWSLERSHAASRS
jgi:hypothetical protein